jgi:plasmid stabilization system protein ParE
MRFNVHLLWRAERDLDHIATWLYDRSPDGAAAWHQAWKNTVKLLEDSANGYGVAPENEDQELEIGQIMFHTRHGRNYRALYTIRGQDVFVMHIRAPGQDIVAADELQLPQ